MHKFVGVLDKCGQDSLSLIQMKGGYEPTRKYEAFRACPLLDRVLLRHSPHTPPPLCIQLPTRRPHG